MIAACCVTLAVLLATGESLPHHQQLYYQVQGAPSTFYYVPQADASSVTNVQRYAAHLPVALPPGAPQYVLLYPGGPQHNFIHHRADEAATNRPTIWNLFNFFQRPTTPPTVVDVETEADAVTTPAAAPGVTMTTAAPPRTVSPVSTTTTTAATTVEETTPKGANEVPAKPEKIVGEGEQEGDGTAGDEEKASLENLDEGLPPNPQSEDAAGDRRQFTLVQQRPQFFGNYDLLNQGNTQQRFGVPPGAVSNFLLFRNGFAKAGMVPAQGRPLKMEEADQTPGAAALSFQQALRGASSGVAPHVYYAPGLGLPALQPQLQAAAPGFLQVVPGPLHPLRRVEPSPAVVVEADRPRKDDSEEVEAGQAGPSVAQAKPQAIALAGVGGMAAAAPVATAVVGPGGLAVAAPTATAVAGPSGGGALVAPVQAAIAAANNQVKKGGAGKARDSNYRQ